MQALVVNLGFTRNMQRFRLVCVCWTHVNTRNQKLPMEHGGVIFVPKLCIQFVQVVAAPIIAFALYDGVLVGELSIEPNGVDDK